MPYAGFPLGGAFTRPPCSATAEELDQPDLVIRAIRDIVDAVRTKATRPPAR